jgi:hypothetical protein
MGPAAGGTTVTITGANLDTATRVTMGAVKVAAFSCASSTTCTFVTPAGTGRKAVRVTTPLGRSATSAADRFHFKAPRG